MHTLVDSPDPWSSRYFSIETPPPKQTIPCGSPGSHPLPPLFKHSQSCLLSFGLWVPTHLHLFLFPGLCFLFWMLSGLLYVFETPLQYPFPGAGFLSAWVEYSYSYFLRHFYPCSEFAITYPDPEVPRDTFDCHCCLKPSLASDTGQPFKRVEERQ